MSDFTSVPLDRLESVSGGASNTNGQTTKPPAKKTQVPSSLDITNGGLADELEKFGFPNLDDNGKAVNGTRASRDMLEGFGTLIGAGHR